MLNSKYKLGECCTIIAGQSPESKYYNLNGDGLPFFQGKADFGDVYPQIRVYCSQPIKIAEKDDILLSVRAPVGPTNLAPCKVCIGRGLTAIRPKDFLLTKYLLLYLKSFELELASQGKGTTFKSITQNIIKNLEIWIPSIEKQKQIVKQIEESLSQLDSAVETLNKTKQQLEIYRQAVLKEAFANFNEFTTIRNATSLVTSGSRGWAKYYSTSGAAFIRIGNLNRYDISISFDDLQCVKLPDHAEGVRSRLEPSDVLISITADLGSIGFVPYNIGEGYINQHIALVRFKNKKQSRFLAWYLRSDIGQKELLKNKRGAGKLGLGLDDIRDALIPVVDDKTAIEVVSKIEEKLVLCSNVEETINQSLQQAEALRQSILKQAFEGNS